MAWTSEGLRNPASTTHLRGATSGSRGRPSSVPVDLGYVRDWSVTYRVMLDGLGDFRWRHARWSLPAGDGLAFGLLYAGLGSPLVRWFSPVDPAASGCMPAIAGRADCSPGKAGSWASRCCTGTRPAGRA